MEVVSIIDVEPGKVYKYTPKVFARNIVYSSDDINLKEVKFKGNINPSIDPYENGARPTTIKSTKYKVGAKDIKDAGDEVCLVPLDYFEFVEMKIDNLEFAIWDPKIEDYILTVDGIISIENKDAPLSIISRLIVNRNEVQLIDPQCPGPVYVNKELDTRQEEANILSIGKFTQGIGSQENAEFNYVGLKKFDAWYGFFQIITSYLQEYKGSKGESVKFKQDLVIDIEPDTGDAIGDVTQAGEDHVIVPFADSPSVGCTPLFSTALGGNVPATISCTPQYIAQSKSIKYSVGFSAYLMMKAGKDIDDPTTFWVPVRKVDWAVDLNTECTQNVCGIGLGTEQARFIPNWSQPAGSSVKTPTEDTDWTKKATPPLWKGFSKVTGAEEVQNAGKYYNFMCSVDSIPLPDDALYDTMPYLFNKDGEAFVGLYED